jgi:hypothetical protein
MSEPTFEQIDRGARALFEIEHGCTEPEYGWCGAHLMRTFAMNTDTWRGLS